MTQGPQTHEAAASPHIPPEMPYLALALPRRMVRVRQGQKHDSTEKRQPDSPRPLAFWHTRQVGQRLPMRPCEYVLVDNDNLGYGVDYSTYPETLLLEHKHERY